MAKPGLKITKENTYKLNATGMIFTENGKIKMDISEDGNMSDIIDIQPYIEELNEQMITLSIRKTEIIED